MTAREWAERFYAESAFDEVDMKELERHFADAMAEARRDAFEEAINVLSGKVDGLKNPWFKHHIKGYPNTRIQATQHGLEIALQSIRALSSKGGGHG